MQTYVYFHPLASFAEIFFCVFKLSIRNQNDMILMECILGKNPVKEFAKFQGLKIGKLEM